MNRRKFLVGLASMGMVPFLPKIKSKKKDGGIKYSPELEINVLKQECLGKNAKTGLYEWSKYKKVDKFRGKPFYIENSNKEDRWRKTFMGEGMGLNQASENCNQVYTRWEIKCEPWWVEYKGGYYWLDFKMKELSFSPRKNWDISDHVVGHSEKGGNRWIPDRFLKFYDYSIDLSCCVSDFNSL